MIVHRWSAEFRDATPHDLQGLMLLWSEVVRPGDPAQREAGVSALLERVAATEDERVLIAEIEGEVAGAVHCAVVPMSPLDPEPMLETYALVVADEFQRRGLGRSLISAAVTFAEERGIRSVATAASAGSRDSHRFFARLAFAPETTRRLVPTQTVRRRLIAESGATKKFPGVPQLGEVLAVRRSRRGHRAAVSRS